MNSHKKKLLVTAPIKRFKDVISRCKKEYDLHIYEYAPYIELEKIIHQYDFLIPNARIKIDKNLIFKASTLKAIYQPSLGYDHIDVVSLKQKNIKFGAISLDEEFRSKFWTTAEHTLMLILASLRNFKEMVDDVDNKFLWDNRKYLIKDLRDLTIGIIGYGNIGRKVCELLKGFGSQILVYDPYVNHASINFDKIKKVSLQNLLKESDVLTLHVPLNEETNNLIAKSELNQMKESSIIINTSRGGILNENDFLWALENKKIFGGGFDVLKGESPDGISNSKIAQISKINKHITITPHVGGSGFKYMNEIFNHSITRLKELENDN